MVACCRSSLVQASNHNNPILFRSLSILHLFPCFRNRYCIGDMMVVRAIKTIGAGDMINENYGPIFTQKRRDYRQRMLRDRYWFDCRCLPCEEDWPLIDEMTDSALRFRCTESRCRKPLVVAVDTMTPFITCPSCKKSNNILKVRTCCCCVVPIYLVGGSRDVLPSL